MTRRCCVVAWMAMTLVAGACGSDGASGDEALADSLWDELNVTEQDALCEEVASASGRGRVLESVEGALRTQEVDEASGSPTAAQLEERAQAMMQYVEAKC